MEKILPPEGQPHTKYFFHKTYHSCVKHQTWIVHTNEKCTLEVVSTDTSKNEDTSSKQSYLESDMQTIIESVDSDEE